VGLAIRFAIDVKKSGVTPGHSFLVVELRHQDANALLPPLGRPVARPEADVKHQALAPVTLTLTVLPIGA